MKTGMDKLQQGQKLLEKKQTEFEKETKKIEDASMDKLRRERELLEKEKAEFAELTKKFESVHFSQVVTLNIGNLVYSPY
jgi:hypothetical protein